VRILRAKITGRGMIGSRAHQEPRAIGVKRNINRTGRVHGMADDGIRARCDDRLAFSHFHCPGQIAVFLHYKKENHIAEEDNRIGGQNQTDRDMGPLPPEVKSRQQKAGQHKKAEERVQDILLPFLLPGPHPPLQKGGVLLQKIEHDQKHLENEQAHINPGFPESEGPGRKKKNEPKYQRCKSKPQKNTGLDISHLHFIRGCYHVIFSIYPGLFIKKAVLPQVTVVTELEATKTSLLVSDFSITCKSTKKGLPLSRRFPES